MKESIMKSEVDEEFIKSAVQDMYRNAFNPEFIFGHIIDFGRKPKNLNK